MKLSCLFGGVLVGASFGLSFNQSAIAQQQAGAQWRSSSGDLVLTVMDRWGRSCASGTAQSSYKVSGGSGGLLYPDDCDDNSGRYRFEDTEGSERCIGTATVDSVPSSSSPAAIDTVWTIDRAVTGFTCSTAGKTFSQRLFISETQSSAPPASTVTQVSTSSDSSCESAINVIEEELAEGEYYIPWATSLPYQPMVYPEFQISEDRIENGYYNYPPERTRSITFKLTGDSTKINQGILSSPQLMSSYTSQIMEACSQIGLVEFQHWWEGVVPFGYFSDGSIRRFDWVDFEPVRGTPPAGLTVRTIQTPNGSRSLYPWGYYYSP